MEPVGQTCPWNRWNYCLTLSILRNNSCILELWSTIGEAVSTKSEDVFSYVEQQRLSWRRFGRTSREPHKSTWWHHRRFLLSHTPAKYGTSLQTADRRRSTLRSISCIEKNDCVCIERSQTTTTIRTVNLKNTYLLLAISQERTIRNCTLMVQGKRNCGRSPTRWLDAADKRLGVNVKTSVTITAMLG